MCKLVNRIRYGKSTKPRFIESRGRWLYKNKWIKPEIAYDILSGKHTRYTYELMRGDFASFGELESFDEVIDMASRYPTQAKFPDLTQFSMQQVDILLGIQHKYVEEQGKKIRKTMVEMNEEIEKIKDKLWY
jgi:hypothetical protein